MSIIRTCDGCSKLIAADDVHAIRDATTGEVGAKPLDWCGPCVAIIHAELPRLALAAREARKAAAAEPVRQRALTLWKGGPERIPAPTRRLQKLSEPRT